MTAEEIYNVSKHFILYYWYVTNVYSIIGSKNRAKLKKCPMSAIRQRFPNPMGTPYTEFQECSKNDPTVLPVLHLVVEVYYLIMTSFSWEVL
jgi:hypothetical protein